MKWERWRHCWRLYLDGKKVATVACKRHWKGYSIFFAYLGGEPISPNNSYSTDGYFVTLKGAMGALEIFAVEQQQNRRAA